MKVIHLNHSDVNGGAARAAYRIHHSLLTAGVDSRMWVNKAASGDWTVEGPDSKLDKAIAAIRAHITMPLTKALKTDNPILHSPAVLRSQWVKRINACNADVVHLHWVQGEMLSIADIGRIEKPVVWTLHDMWAFCGAEHYTVDFRWRDGYRRDNRPAHESGFDLNRWSWKRKRKHWKPPMHIVTPSHWLADCARESVIMSDWPVSVVPNCLDTQRWMPMDQPLARQLLGLPDDVPLLLFGAMGGGSDPRKGFDLLQEALKHLRGQPISQGIELVVFGQSAPKDPPAIGFPIHYTGHLFDDLSLRALYSAVDVMVVPSRQDNLPNTAVEAQASGTPVVAFDIGGLADIVEHKITGYLAKAFDVNDLASGITWMISQSHIAKQSIRSATRDRAVRLFSNTSVAEQYCAIYKQSIA